MALPGQAIPWYLRQQALLFLAAFDPAGVPVIRMGTKPELRHYLKLIRFLRGEREHLWSSDFATLAVLARRAFVDRERAVNLTRPGLNRSRKRQLAQRDLSFLLELIGTETDAHSFCDLPARIRDDLCWGVKSSNGKQDTLATAILKLHPSGVLRNELSLLRFAKAFLETWEQQECAPAVITPGQVRLRIVEDQNVADVKNLQILVSRAGTSGSLYEVPAWCPDGERWRFQLGFLLRFILSGQPDFTRPVRKENWKVSESSYRPAEPHWYQRMYGLYSGQPAFGHDWLPITEWVEGFLLDLLHWPGCHVPDLFSEVEQSIQETKIQIDQRIADLEQKRGSATRELILPLRARRPPAMHTKRPLRACVVQTAIPADDDFKPTDLALNEPAIRRRHRNHLSAALASVERMLALRDTHKGKGGRLDWLILPELAVHPNDVDTHLVPFARAHRTMILAGLTYEKILAEQPLINSALWIIPEWSNTYGLQIKTRRQGKAHLASKERKFKDDGGVHLLRGFRPCQWLIGYPWSDEGRQPIWLTAAVCYDATDLGLVTDLRDESDVLAIPALNQDVKTFDNMAEALHYHMFQLVVVANNGQYGGSNAYWPRSKAPHVRQVFHTHGQPQTAISFFEIDDIGWYLERHDMSGANVSDWKYPPAGLNMELP
ncbi:MAG: hypothetical protein F4X16_14240 [Caldilineaceae bacterium SB0661_bin_34]|nr:hypothetical protein [Caldilineaceae bacterium SB0661_bin_34]